MSAPRDPRANCPPAYVNEYGDLAVEGAEPSKALLESIIENGKGVVVHSMPPGGLSFLARFASRLRSLSVGVPLSAPDYAMLSKMTVLESLHAMSWPDAPVTLGTRCLRQMSGPAARGWRSVLDQPELEVLAIEGADWSWVEGAIGPLRSFYLVGVRRPVTLTACPSAMTLEHLVIHQVPFVDIAAVREMPAIRKLTISSVRELVGVSTAGLGRLDRLDLERVQRVDDPDVLLHEHPHMAVVVGSGPLNPATGHQPAAIERNWYIEERRTSTRSRP